MEMKRPEHHSGGVPAVSQGWNWWLVEWLYVARGNLNDAMTPNFTIQRRKRAGVYNNLKNWCHGVIGGTEAIGRRPEAGPDDGVRRLRRASP